MHILPFLVGPVKGKGFCRHCKGYDTGQIVIRSVCDQVSYIIVGVFGIKSGENIRIIRFHLPLIGFAGAQYVAGDMADEAVIADRIVFLIYGIFQARYDGVDADV